MDSLFPGGKKKVSKSKQSKLQSLLTANASKFTVTIGSYSAPTGFVNYEALVVSLDHLLKSQKRGLKNLRPKFLEIARRAGYTSAA